MNQVRKKQLAAGVVAAGLLAACGGSDGDSFVAGTDVPVNATRTSADALAFTAGVAAKADDTAEPLTLGDAALATSETDEPASI